MEKKRKGLYYIVLILFMIFSCIYFISSNGYYEYTLHSKTVLNREKILEFEKDIEDNKEIDIKKYYQEEKKYSNRLSNNINDMSKGFVKLSRRVMKRIFRFLNKYFND